MGIFADYIERKSAKLKLPDSESALPGRDRAILDNCIHHVKGVSIFPPFPENLRSLVVGMGCFWGAEKLMWNIEGVWVSAVGYSGGITPNPTYDEVCSGLTGHSEVVLVVYDPVKVELGELIAKFFEGHDPTQGFAQGNDIGTQYRSYLTYNTEVELELILKIRDAYQIELSKLGHGQITTEISPLSTFYYAEEHHQQYLSKNLNGYCGIGGTGVTCPTGLMH